MFFSNASQATNSVDTATLIIALVSLFFTVAITGTMIYFVLKYNRKDHPVPADIHGHVGLEVLWTAIPTLLVLVFFYYGYLAFLDIRTFPDEAIEVDVTARMWSWSFEYPNGEVTTELYVPQGKDVKLNLAAIDVIHSLYIPAFRVKQDCVPGIDTAAWFRANNQGTYELFCTEYCGLLHSNMLSKVHVVSEEDWKKKIYGGEDIDLASLASGKEKAVAALSATAPKKKAASGAGLGAKLVKTNGCVACHSMDGSKLVGPSFKGLYGKEHVVLEDGKEVTVVADDDYIRHSITNPNAQVVKGYGALMPAQNLKDDEIDAVISYLKTLE